MDNWTVSKNSFLLKAKVWLQTSAWCVWTLDRRGGMSDGIIHSNSLLHGWNCNLHFIDSYKNARFAQNWLLFFCWWLTFWQRKEVLPAAAASSSQHQKRKLHTRFLTSSNFSPLYASAFRHQTLKIIQYFPCNFSRFEFCYNNVTQGTHLRIGCFICNKQDL